VDGKKDFIPLGFDINVNPLLVDIQTPDSARFVLIDHLVYCDVAMMLYVFT